MAIPEFILAAGALLVTPGPTNTLLAAAAAERGLRRALPLILAEAAGYAIAIGGFLGAATLLAGLPATDAALKAIAAVWLTATAIRLWQSPVTGSAGTSPARFRTILLTTILNPKAMLVGTLVIPALMPGAPVAGLIVFLGLSILAGASWVAAGSVMPQVIRRRASRLSAVVIAGFAAVAAAGALHG